MSKRIKSMFSKLGMEIPAVHPAPDVSTPRRASRSRRRASASEDDDDNSLIYTESEAGVLHPEFVKSHVKVDSWIKNRYLKESQKNQPEETTLSPVKSEQPILVDYASSNVSTPPKDSSKVNGKENKQNVLKGSKRSGLPDSCTPPLSKRKSLESAVDQLKQGKNAAPAKLSPYTLLKKKMMNENAEVFQKQHGIQIPASELVFCRDDDVDMERDKNQNDAAGKGKDFETKSTRSASSDSYCPSSPSGSSSSSASDFSPPKKKDSSSKRISPQARKGLCFGNSNTAVESCSSTNLATVPAQDQTRPQSAKRDRKVDSPGNQGSTKGVVAVSARNDKKDKPVPANKEKPVPSLKPLPAQKKQVNASKLVLSPKEVAGKQLTGSTTPKPCSAALTQAAHTDTELSDSLSDGEANKEASSTHDNDDMEEAYLDTAEPLSEDDLQDLSANNNKPPTRIALKIERKKLRNSGLEYQTPKGIIIKKKEQKPVHTCSTNECHKHISKDAADTLFERFWNLNCHNKQTQYVSSLVEHDRPQRRRVRKEDSGKNRKVTYHYHLDVESVRVKVCKSTFLGTLGLTQTFVRNVTDKKLLSPGGLIPEDGRGHHKPPHSLSEETKQAVNAHIESFPSYVSHYSRSQTKSLYFPSNLSYKKMYRLYKEQDNPYVSYSAYKKFVKKTGKKFKKPSNDTCGKCDKLKIEISLSQGEAKRKSEIALELHHRKAEEAYAVKRNLKKEASTNDKMLVLVYDLEQCLPTPMLRCGESYYTRQLNTFNLTVCDTKTKLTFCYMWHEAEGGRSANAIASCLYRHILQFVPHGVERLVLFSDACTSQNRNSHIAAMYFVALQEHTSLKTVEHMFLVSGHTHMEADNKHSVIERYKKTLDRVSVPEEWYDAVKAAGQQNDNDYFPDGKFKVIPMKGNFYDFASLLKGPLVKRERTAENNKFSWLDTFVFRYSKERVGVVEVKGSHNPAVHFEELSFIRVGGRSSTLPELSNILRKCFTTPQPISALKKKDLLKLLPFIDEDHHAFYHDLTTTNSIIEDTDVDLPEDE